MRRASQTLFVAQLRTDYRKAVAKPTPADPFFVERWRGVPTIRRAFESRARAEQFVAENYPPGFTPFWPAVQLLSATASGLEFYDDNGNWAFHMSDDEWSDWLRGEIRIPPPDPKTMPMSRPLVEEFWADWLKMTLPKTSQTRWHTFWHLLNRDPFEIIEIEMEEG
jgi:hypothetical protein